LLALGSIQTDYGAPQLELLEEEKLHHDGACLNGQLLAVHHPAEVFLVRFQTDMDDTSAYLSVTPFLTQ